MAPDVIGAMGTLICDRQVCDLPLTSIVLRVSNSGYSTWGTPPNKLSWNPKTGGLGRCLFLSQGGIFKFQPLVFMSIYV